MSVGHGSHATMTAKPGKGDELIEFPMNAPSLPNEDCLGQVVAGRTVWANMPPTFVYFCRRPRVPARQPAVLSV